MELARSHEPFWPGTRCERTHRKFRWFCHGCCVALRATRCLKTRGCGSICHVKFFDQLPHPGRNMTYDRSMRAAVSLRVGRKIGAECWQTIGSIRSIRMKCLFVQMQRVRAPPRLALFLLGCYFCQFVWWLDPFSFTSVSAAQLRSTCRVRMARRDMTQHASFHCSVTHRQLRL